MTYGLPDSVLIGTAKRIASLGRSRGGGSRGRGKLSIDFSYKFKGLTIRRAEFDTMLNSTRGTVGRYMHKKAVLMTTAAKAQVGKKTGNLMRSIKYVHSRNSLGQSFTVGSNLNYALLHHEGTKPHIITPNEANILRFTAGGRVVYTHKVNHPGTRPNKYLSDQLSMVRI
jgi:hypothetical protein